METIITERIMSLVDEFAGGKKEAFAQMIGQKKSTFSAWINHNKWTDVEKLEAIISKLPGINRDWLYAGQGEMIKAIRYNSDLPISGVKEPCPDCLMKEGKISLLKEQICDCHREVGELRERIGMSRIKDEKKHAC